MFCENYSNLDEDNQGSVSVVELDESISDVEEHADANDEVYLQRKLASLFLRMQTLLHVSKSATQEIIDGFYEVSVLTGELIKKLMEQILLQHNINLETSTVITETFDKTVPLSFFSRTGPLGTDHKRSSFFKENFTVIEPFEYILDSDKGRKKVYVPILPVLNELNRDYALNKVFLRRFLG